MYVRTGIVFGTYVHSVLPQNAVHPGLGKDLNSEESPDTTPGGIRDDVGVFEIVRLLIGHKKITDGSGFERGQGVFLTPQLIGLVNIFGRSAAVRFQPYRSAASAGETAALIVSILFIESLL